ncbi:MAG: putative gluconeogenesis factor [Candidatus Parcubacteria bacterium]|nr:MAG: putative gluconeogenesis factor [Candidatus Parcubacteria bacterium]
MKIVIFGGGTGLSNILTGLKKDYGKKIKNLTAVVTVADSGGSSGILRQVYDIPAVGDLRNCLLALSNIENYVRKVMQYRFTEGQGLRGHPLGNLFLVALLETEGNILKAVKKAAKILNISGEVFPVTFEKTELIAFFEDKSKIVGENEITNYGILSQKRIVSLKIRPENPKVPKELVKRIEVADVLIFGPGSLYTSILPNVLIKKIKETIEKSKALRIFIVNLLTQPGETDNFSASQHLKEFLRISGLNKIDIAILNCGKPSKEQEARIKDENKKLVENDLEELEKMGVKFYLADLINQKDIYVKHDPFRLRDVILKIVKDYDII